MFREKVREIFSFAERYAETKLFASRSKEWSKEEKEKEVIKDKYFKQYHHGESETSFTVFLHDNLIAYGYIDLNRYDNTFYVTSRFKSEIPVIEDFDFFKEAKLEYDRRKQDIIGRSWPGSPPSRLLSTKSLPLMLLVSTGFALSVSAVCVFIAFLTKLFAG